MIASRPTSTLLLLNLISPGFHFSMASLVSDVLMLAGARRNTNNAISFKNIHYSNLICRVNRDGFEDTMFEAKARQRRGQGQGQTTSRPRPNYLEAVSRPKPNLFYLKNYWCKIVHCMRVEQQQMARYIVI